MNLITKIINIIIYHISLCPHQEFVILRTNPYFTLLSVVSYDTKSLCFGLAGGSKEGVKCVGLSLWV